MTEDKGLGLKSWLSGPTKRREAKAEEVSDKLVPLDVHHRLAVLPFANMSPDPQDEYFADGMTEEVISTLSKVPGVEVISRTSVMQYKKNPKSVKEVSKELDVAIVLEGGVRKMGNKLRITVQMIDASRDRHLWAESYDRELQDIFAIQSEVAARVAESLLVKTVQGSRASLRKKPTASTEAYSLYLKGRYHWNKRSIEDIKVAIDCFQRAVAEDPRFGLGYVGLADCFSILSATWRIDSETNHEKSKTMVARALELDPEMAEAHATKGLTLLDEFRFKEAEEEFRRTLALNPSYAPARLWYYLLLLAQLRMNEALEQIEKAVELDPLSPNMSLNYASYYYAKRDYRTALDLAKRSADLDQKYAPAHFSAGYMYGKLKMFSEARQEFGLAANLLERTYPLVGKSAQMWLAFLEDDREGVSRLLPEIRANLEKSYADASSIALVYFYLGEDDKGFDWLERAYSSKGSFIHNYDSLMDIRTEEMFARVREDPRFSDFLKRLGLIEHHYDPTNS